MQKCTCKNARKDLELVPSTFYAWVCNASGRKHFVQICNWKANVHTCLTFLKLRCMLSYSLKSKLNAYVGLLMCMSYGMGIHVLWDIYISLLCPGQCLHVLWNGYIELCTCSIHLMDDINYDILWDGYLCPMRRTSMVQEFMYYRTDIYVLWDGYSCCMWWIFMF